MTYLVSSLLTTPFVKLPTVKSCCRGARPFHIQVFIFTLILLHFPFLPYFVTQNFPATGPSAGKATLLHPLCASLACNWTAFILLYLILSKYFSTFSCEQKQYTQKQISPQKCTSSMTVFYPSNSARHFARRTNQTYFTLTVLPMFKGKKKMQFVYTLQIP